MDVYFFDCDDTLYDYDFHKRLPALAEFTGRSQYHLASTWWAGGRERAAEAGEYPTTQEYLEAFHQVTGANLSLEQWRNARKAAMTEIEGSIDALRWATDRGATSLLSNNPIPFHDCFPHLAPEANALLDGNNLVSAMLGARKPDPVVFANALERLGAQPNDAILIDDSAANVRGAIEAGMHGYQIVRDEGRYDTVALQAALEAFAAR